MYELKINSKNQMFGASDDGLYRSTDNGESWTHLNTGSAKFVSCIAFNSNDDIFIGITDSVFRSTDNGENWEGITGNLPKNLNIRCITINTDNFIIIGTNDGVFRSTNNGITWQLCGVYRTYILSTVRNSKDYIFFSTIMSSGGGIFRSTDKGNTWDKVMEGNANYLSMAVDSNDYIYTQGQFTGIFKSTDNGNSWFENTSFPQTIVKEMLVNNSNYIFAATEKGIFASNNGAKTWHNITGNLSDSFISSIAINEKGEIFAGTESGIFKCDTFFIDSETDSFPLEVGNYWQFRVTNLHGTIPLETRVWYDYMRVIKDTLIGEDSVSFKKLKSFKIPPYYLDTVMYLRYDSLSESILEYNACCEDKDTLFKLNARVEESWWAGSYYIYCTDIDTLQIFNKQKLFRTFSANARPFWYYKLAQGFGPIEIFDDDSYVITNTITYKLIYANIKAIEYGEFVPVNDDNPKYPVNYTLFQNYPNPFNPSTKIKYSIPKISFVTLKIFDILGREITTLVNEEKPAGNFEVEFDGAELSSGIYFYKLQTGNYSEVKKMILIK